MLRTDGITTGPDGVTLNALEFNGEDQFAHIQHDVATNVTQGTIALWVRPDDLSEFSTMVSKDQSGTGDGGHFRLSHTEDGALYLRFAPGDGGGNKAWKTANPQLTEGEWSHLAVSYGADGVTVYVDGKAIPDFVWYRVEGNVETPGVYEEAYMVANEEAWLLGADSYVSKGSTTAAEFAVNDDRLQKAFDGAIAEFGVWGGFTEDDILTKSQINELIDDGPGAALTNPSGPQPIIAGDDLFQGGDGDDMIFGEGGDDTLEGGAGDDTIEGGYGDDSINGGDGADVLDGGRGNDLVIGGLGNDVLYSRSDAGEQRLGQLVLDDPSRPDDGSIDYDYLKLVDWIDQPLKADDVLVGGEGNDLFYFEPLLNAKKDIILEHVREDRTINWAGVAGENTYLHDHWADQFGIDIIADYVAAEDTIAVIGHTANILSVEHQTVDTDGDGINDSAMSLVQVYSQQGNNGGAHDEDLLGMIVVFGDLVYEDDIVTNPGVTPGIVDTIDELQEALAPTGETKVTFTADGVELFGYDSRDVEGDPLGTDPLSYSDNPFLAAGDVTFQNQLAELGAPVILLENAGGTFDGEDDFVEVLHEPELAQAEGAWTFSFNADTPGDGDQTLLSKDHSGLKDGGHLTFWVTDDARLEVRFQSETRSYHIKTDRNAIEPGETYSVAFNFIEDEISLYLDGDLVGSQSGFPTGMLGNTEDLVIGSSSTTRNGDKDNLKEFFDGTISDIAVFDRALEPIEVLLLAEASGSATTIGNPPPPPPVAGIVGDEAANRLNGTAEDDVIDGAGGNDIINGLGGADIMMGGDGDDRFYCDDEGDQIIEAAGGGYDRVYTSVSATLSANVEAVKATGTTAIDLTGNASDNWIDGNSAANTLLGGEGSDRLRGREGDDVLDGEGGNDILEGGTGSDIFRVGPDGGVDMVLDFELGLDRIDLTATGASPAGLTINDSAQGARIQYDDANLGNVVILKGVYASDLSVLDFIHEGISAAEMIQGTDANDVLRAWDGDAMLIGGAGDDRFYVDGPADQVIEALGEGYDRVYAQGEFTLSDNIEAISAHGSDAVVLTGNGLDNWVTGGAGDDTLSGEGGNDRLQGRDGADLLDGGLGNDILNGGTGSDIFRFEVGDGADLVQDFERGSDVIDLSGTGLSFGDLGIYDTAQGAMIFYRADDGSVLQFTMNGVTAGQISESDFAF
ncbi:MAG: LamG-like jellyroll fold domain-containing protein [Pseudomonadota bacterium]